MSETIRAFIGIPCEVGPELHAVLARLGRMGRAVRPVKPDGMHVTMHFFGDISRGEVEPLCETVAALNAAHSLPLLEVAGWGAFPTMQRPSVIWAGVEPAEPVRELAAALNERLETLGYPSESREFTPHLTLARIKARPPSDLFDLLEAASTEPWARIPQPRLVLFRSHLSPDGARYEPLCDGPARGDAEATASKPYA